MNPVLYVRNIEQAAAWLELDGQISDGYWENARPYDHWKVWTDAEVVVANDTQPTGRNFRAVKDNYNFAAPELLDVVGKRMLGVVRIARALGIDVARRLEHEVDCDTGRIEWFGRGTDDYWVRRRAALADLPQDRINAALADESYTMAHLKRDLADLKQIAKTRLGV